MPIAEGTTHVFSPVRSLRQLLAITTAIGIALPACAQQAFAQDTSTAAPPARVGQVANVSGSVSYNGAGSNGQWVAATPNYPVTTGDSLFTQNGAEASLVLDSSRLTLGPNTELQVTALDNENFTATESQGEVFVNLTDLQPGQNFILNTPRGAVNISQSGEYDIAAGDANTPTTVSVLAGSASIGQLQVPAGQAGYLSGTDQTTAQLGPLQHDAFMDHVLAELAPPPPPYAPPVVAQMTGVSELSSYGSWDQSPQYGAVWYPSVDSGWAPYREGHWAFVAPWGWTWVDVEPWGFAPFHYGRWIQDSGRWGWVPAGAYVGGGYGPDYQPVYAPAVVGFFGLGVGVAITAAILSSGSIGWVPLAPGEAYYPSYHADPDYMRRINRVDVRNFTQINVHNTTVINNYANRRAATYIPGAAMARGESVAHYGHAVPEGMFAQARPVQGNFNEALRPNFAPRAAAAPHLTDFAQRREVPQAVISHTPMQPGARPQGAEIHQNFPGSNGGMIRPGETARPQVQPGQEMRPGAQPGYRPEVQPNNRPEAQPSNRPAAPAQQFHPQAVQQPFHPQEPAQQFHAPMPQVYTPHAPAQPENRPIERPQPEQQFHQAQPQFHPQEQQFHPQAQPQFHPQQQQQFRPQEQARPQEAPRPQAARPNNAQDNHRP
jgi:hypothetical protein